MSQRTLLASGNDVHNGIMQNFFDCTKQLVEAHTAHQKELRSQRQDLKEEYGNHANALLQKQQEVLQKQQELTDEHKQNASKLQAENEQLKLQIKRLQTNNDALSQKLAEKTTDYDRLFNGRVLALAQCNLKGGWHAMLEENNIYGGMPGLAEYMIQRGLSESALVEEGKAANNKKRKAAQ